jgi:glycerophosphoryl diester phosphodiesterase
LEAPENTLAAFALAHAQGADGVELDAQLCASGEVVVHHDGSLGRTTGRAALLAETPWSVVRTLDAGARFDARFAGERVPRLAEALRALPSLRINVELKCPTLDDRGLAAAAVREIRDARAEERVLLSSFNPHCLWRARALAPHLPRALLFDDKVYFASRHALFAPALGLVALHPDEKLAGARALRRWRARGYGVAAWTVDDPLRARALAEAGCTALITNVPGAILAAFAARAA